MKRQITFQSQTCTKKVVVSVCGLLPVYPLQLSESWWNHYIWEVHLANWWDALKTAMPAASIVQPKGPISAQHLPAGCTTSAPKAERIGLWSFAIHHIHVNSCQLLLQASSQLFAGKMLPQPAGGRKCFPRVHRIPKHNLYALGINKLISRRQKCVNYNVSYFD